MHHFSKGPYEGFWGKYSNCYICVYRQCKKKKKKIRYLPPAEKLVGSKILV